MPQVAGGIFDLMEKFAGYGFNKSHSAAYALVSYQTAWLKAPLPVRIHGCRAVVGHAHTDKAARRESQPFQVRDHG
jgi:DNA polymerase-3 subunit alpha